MEGTIHISIPWLVLHRFSACRAQAGGGPGLCQAQGLTMCCVQRPEASPGTGNLETPCETSQGVTTDTISIQLLMEYVDSTLCIAYWMGFFFYRDRFSQIQSRRAINVPLLIIVILKWQILKQVCPICAANQKLCCDFCYSWVPVVTLVKRSCSFFRSEKPLRFLAKDGWGWVQASIRVCVGAHGWKPEVTWLSSKCQL